MGIFGTCDVCGAQTELELYGKLFLCDDCWDDAYEIDNDDEEIDENYYEFEEIEGDEF